MWANGKAGGARLKQASAYVAQEELYVPTLSCWETLRFHAVLRNRERASKGALKERMQDVLSVTGLWKVQRTQVQGTKTKIWLSAHNDCSSASDCHFVTSVHEMVG